MKTVSNASPLINLARIGRLDVLRDLYRELLIPEAVRQEVVVEGEGKPGAMEVARSDWIITQQVSNDEEVKLLRFDLDAGEAASIVLALEQDADLLLMDDRMGRKLAEHMGLIYTGTVGALIEAKKTGIIESIEPILEDLRDRAGFRMTDSLINHALTLADEM